MEVRPPVNARLSASNPYDPCARPLRQDSCGLQFFMTEGARSSSKMQYSAKFKEKMVKKMTGPGAWSATALSAEVDVAQATLSRWLKRAKLGAMSNEIPGSKANGKRKRRTPEEKVRVVQKAAKLNEAGLGAFLRREGLHDADLERLREEVAEAAVEGLQAKRPKKRGPSAEQKKIRRLEKEIRRKDRALAETAALLVLQGKVKAFLLAEEEGDTDESSDS